MKPAKSAKYPVRLIVKGSNGPCGCRFGYAAGFKLVCEFHLEQREAIHQARLAANAAIHRLCPEVKKPRARKKAQADSPELISAFRAEIARRTEILRVERSKIKRPTSKLTKRQREHLHSFAFTAEGVRAELLDKSGNRK